MLKLPPKEADKERDGKGHKRPKGLHVVYRVSPRSFRNNNSSRMWSIMCRDEVARKFQENTNKSIGHMESVAQPRIDRAFKIPERRKAPNKPVAILKPDGSMNLPPYRNLRKKGNYSLHEQSKESTFGRTTEEIGRYYDTIAFKPGKRMMKATLKPPPYAQPEKFEEKQIQSISNLRKQQHLKGTLEFKTRLCNDVLKNSLDSHHVFSKQLAPCSRAFCKRNDSSQMSSLLTRSSGLNKPDAGSVKSIYTSKKNYSDEVAELLGSHTRPFSSTVKIKPPWPRKRRVSGCDLNTSSHFTIGKRIDEKAESDGHLEIKHSIRVFPHKKTLEKNWPDYPPIPPIRRKRFIETDDHAAKRIMSTKAVNPSGKTAVVARQSSSSIPLS